MAGFRRGLIVGFGVGYVLGARAGRERYQQIVTWWRRVSGNPAVQQAAGRGKEIAETAGRKGLGMVQHGVQRVGSSVRGRLGSDEEDGQFMAEGSFGARGPSA
ncbi:MAG: YtxH domain-containing protein [Actinomycetota bacterium]|nr:YtxH domain-containing protein [Actinomycetota bacterium]